MTDAEKISGSPLYNFITSDRNIYRAIYALESYINEPNLLSDKDLKLYYDLADKFNWKKINGVISECRDILGDILTNPDKLFRVNVYFRLKKYDKKTHKVIYRPLHTASLTDLISMVSILQILMFEDSDEQKAAVNDADEKSEDCVKSCRNPSDLSKSIPSNFYGNKTSKQVDRIFQKWHASYQEYNRKIVESSRAFRKSHKYKYEVSLDIQNFFPSISPFYMFDKICRELSGRYKDADRLTLRMGVAKLLFLKIEDKGIDEDKFGYYDSMSFPTGNTVRLAKGVAQGLPQSYFFGNLCMTDIRRLLASENFFCGEDYFYVDDSVIYIGDKFKNGGFEKKIEELNDEIAKTIKSESEDKTRFNGILNQKYVGFHQNIKYDIKFHDGEKSTIQHIDYTDFKLGLEGLVNANSATEFFNLDETDDYISKEKMMALSEYVDKMIEKCEAEIE